MAAVLNNFEWLEWILLGVNVVLLLASRRIVERFTSKRKDRPTLFAGQLGVFRAINIAVFFLVLFFNLFLPLSGELWARILSLFIVAYVSQLFYHVLGWGIQRRYGRTRMQGGQEVVSETYNSRALKLLTGFLTGVISLLAMINILGFDSLLEAGGVIGFLGVLLALTQATWAPDIVSGLIILNSNLIEEGDVIQIDADARSITGVVYKTKMFHTEVLDLTNNHRIMFRNSHLREFIIHNLSKFASPKGLREVLRFKIGYDEPERAVRRMFASAFEAACCDPDIAVESNFPMEVRVEDAGDDAVEWGFYFYTRAVRKILQTRQQVREIILRRSIELGISLATPDLYIIERAGAFATPTPIKTEGPAIKTEGGAKKADDA